jgi:hypothetical protein
MLFELIIVAQMLRQEGTGDLIPRAEPIPNRPQYQHPGGPVGRPDKRGPAGPPMGWSDLFKACVSVECRMFCKPDNEMRPDWCKFYNAPKGGYIEYRPQLEKSAP